MTTFKWIVCQLVIVASTIGCTTMNVRGTVVNTTGEPIAKAKVVVSGWYPFKPIGTFDQNARRLFTTTDDIGEFHVTGTTPLPYDDLHIEIVSKDNYRFASFISNGTHRFVLDRKIGEPNNGKLQWVRYETFYQREFRSADE